MRKHAVAIAAVEKINNQTTMEKTSVEEKKIYKGAT